MKSDFKRIVILLLAASLYFALSEGRKKLNKMRIVKGQEGEVFII